MAKKDHQRWIVLSQVGLQMGVTVFLGARLGKYLDERYPSNKNWFTISLTILAVVISFYLILKKVNKLNEEEDRRERDH